MSSNNIKFKLNTGAEIPAIGFGTGGLGPDTKESVLIALKSGYTSIDTAFRYDNEQCIGEAIKASGIQRESLFITSKVAMNYARCPEDCLDLSLKALGTSYCPLPNSYDASNPKGIVKAGDPPDIDHEWTPLEPWQRMEKILETGKAKAIGVSNFPLFLLEILIEEGKVVPAVNQVEVHPLCPGLKLSEYCRSKGILLQAYSQLGGPGSPLLQHQMVLSLATKYSVPAGTIILSWLFARGIASIPRSKTSSRIEENRKTVELDEKDVDILNEMVGHGKGQRWAKQDWAPDIVFEND